MCECDLDKLVINILSNKEFKNDVTNKIYKNISPLVKLHMKTHLPILLSEMLPFYIENHKNITNIINNSIPKIEKKILHVTQKSINKIKKDETIIEEIKHIYKSDLDKINTRINYLNFSVMTCIFTLVYYSYKK